MPLEQAAEAASEHPQDTRHAWSLPVAGSTRPVEQSARSPLHPAAYPSAGGLWCSSQIALSLSCLQCSGPLSFPEMISIRTVRMTAITVNGKIYEVASDARTPLLWVLRDELRLTGTKFGFGIRSCGRAGRGSSRPIKPCCWAARRARRRTEPRSRGGHSRPVRRIPKATPANRQDPASERTRGGIEVPTTPVQHEFNDDPVRILRSLGAHKFHYMK